MSIENENVLKFKSARCFGGKVWVQNYTAMINWLMLWWPWSKLFSSKGVWQDVKISNREFSFFLFQLETSQNCIFDYLEIYDGESDTANRLGKLCGSETPDTIESSGPQLFLRFHSDSSGELKGFKLRYAKKAGTVSGYSINALSFTSVNQSLSQAISQVIFGTPGYMEWAGLIHVKIKYIQIT